MARASDSGAGGRGRAGGDPLVDTLGDSSHELTLGGAGLLLVAGEGLFTMFPLLDAETVIGRGDDCQVRIPHDTLSRRHALLRRGPPLSVEDLGSKNGTRVARRRLQPGERAPLSTGESFHIGRFSLVLVSADPARSLHSGTRPQQSLQVLDPTAEQATPLLRDLARSSLSALILGETGVGKEVLAESLHRLSGRSGAFVRVNCAAVAPALFESELFGHERGAFTGASAARAGLLEAAHRGTVLLDEVGELPPEAQAKLLRAIEAREVLRVGAVRPVPIDVRFLAASNRDLAAEVARGAFRADLFYRLDGVTLVLPPLRQRRERIAPLALEFLQQAHERSGRTEAPRLAPDLLPRLVEHDWPGNVRELRAVLERGLLLARGGELSARHLALADTGRPRAERPASATDPALPPVAAAAAAPVADPAEERARREIIEALEACAGNQTRAARLLGISRATLVTRLAVYRIPRPRK